jgi:translation initiation factor IF-2
MALEDMEKRYRISDIARELQVSPQEVLLFVKQEGVKVASTSSMVSEEIHGLIFGHFSVEKKMVDDTKKIRAEKEKRLSRLEEQSRKTYEKEQHLSETLSPQPLQVAPPVTVVPPAPVPVAHNIKSEVVDAVVASEIAELLTEHDVPVAELSAPVILPEVLELFDANEYTEPEPTTHIELIESIEIPLPTQEIPEVPEPELQKEEPSVNEHLISFDAPQMMGGLTVLGTLDMQAGRNKKNRKKDFKEQADALKDEFVPKVAVELREEEKVALAKKPLKAVVEVKPKVVVADSSSIKKKKGKKKKKIEVDDKVISANIQKTISGIEDRSSTGSRQKFRKLRRNEREREHEEDEAFRESQRLIVRVTEYASPHELAELMGITAKDIIQKCFALGKFVTINQRLDKESIELIALEFGFEAEFISEVEATAVIVEEDAEEDLQTRPPVVTIMGHVDHGKTSLLDHIRNSKVVAGESGGITQHIGAYEVTVDGNRKITFLDTPGHEAFTAMRARGAQVTDIVILVVAADDSVMPQTIEAINHAKAAGVPIVVALNKIDKVEANPEKIKTQLSEAGVLVEEWGGAYQCQEISAKKGIGIAELMEKVLTEAEMRELKGNYSPDIQASGIIVESELDKGKGVISTVLVQRGILKVGDPFAAGNTMGKVRALMDERGKRILFANPSQPVRVLGFEELPQSGDAMTVMVTDREARDLAQKRQVIRREHDLRRSTRVKLDSIARQIKEGLMKELSVIIKADTDGSIQALADGLMKIQNEEVKVQIIHQGVGQITETDVLLAAASDAIIIGFRVRPNVNAKKLAEKEDLDVRFYSVIYHVLEDVEKALEGMLSPELHEESLGSLEIRQIFKVPKIGNVGGCYVLEGKVFRDSKVRLLRDGVQIYEGQLAALRRFKDDVKEVDAGYECGMSLKNYDDFKVGDVVEAYKIVEKKRKL